MRAFVILCFVALCAADVTEIADDGYNYNKPGHESELTTVEGDTDNGHAGGGSDFGAASGVESGFSHPARESNLGLETLGGPGTVSKRYFSFTGVDDDQDDDDDDESYSRGAEHKHYDIVFAHAPTPSIKSALKAFSKYAGQQQTAVYVLSKKLGADEIGHALRNSGIKPNRPEVHFIKYKTPEEAAFAQHQVKAQYDELGGRSEFGGEQNAPVHSVIGSAGHRRRPANVEREDRRHPNRKHHESDLGFSSGIPPLPFSSKKYLPPRH